MAAGAAGADRKPGKLEAAYGTAPGGNYAKLPFVSCDLGAEQPLEPNDVLGLGREPPAPSRGAVTATGQMVVPIDLRNLGFWLSLLVGPPTTTGTSPDFVHVFASGAAVLPSATLEVGHPEVPRYFQNLGVMANSLKLPWAATGKANATLAVIAKGARAAPGPAAPARRPPAR